MKNTLFFVLLTLCACTKEEYQKCPSCNVDTSPKTLTFTVNGQLLDKCSGLPVANKKIEWFQMKNSQNTPPSMILGQDGKFTITYSDVFVFAQPINPNSTSPFVIRVSEDSMLFVLPATINYSNLLLNLKDSINCKVNVEFAPDSRQFTSSDTIVYTFEGVSNFYNWMYDGTRKFKKAGPIENETIGTFKDRIKVVYIDEKGKPYVQCTWVIASKQTITSSPSFVANTSKMPCEIGNDSVIIKLKL